MTTTLEHQPIHEPTEVSRQPGSTLAWADSLEQRLEKRAVRRDGWTLSIFFFAGIAVIFSMIGIGMGSRAIDEAKRTVRTGATAPVAPAPTAPILAASPGPLTLGDFTVEPAATTVPPGIFKVSITNSGMVEHELLVFRSDLAPSAYPLKNGDIDEEGAGITKISDGANIAPGATETRTIDLTLPGTYLFVCNLPVHFHAHMYSVVTVK